MRSILLLGALLISLSGCATNIASRYAPAADNVAAIRAISGPKVSVGAFTQPASITAEGLVCVGKPTLPPDGQTFAEYVRGALMAELKMADRYAENAPIRITGDLTAIENQASMFDVNAAWLLSIKLAANGRSMSVSDKFSFRAVAGEHDSCSGSAYRLGDAVQNLLGKIVRSPEFARLIQP